MRTRILIFGFLFLSACGGGEGLQGITFSESAGEAGYVHLNISDAAGAISQFRIQIEGDDFTTIEQTLSAQAGGVVIGGIPGGSNRVIRIWALNSAGQILREGVLENVTVDGGQTQSLDISLQAVPFVLNLADGDYQSNRRLYFHILTDPNHRVGVEGYSDLVSRETEKTADANGRVRFYPGLLPPGDYSFRIFDDDSGKSVPLNIHLWEGQDVQAAPLMAASLNDASRLGQSLVGENYFPNIAEVLWNTR